MLSVSISTTPASSVAVTPSNTTPVEETGAAAEAGVVEAADGAAIALRKASVTRVQVDPTSAFPGEGACDWEEEDALSVKKATLRRASPAGTVAR